jgi:phage terminase small subunit
VDEYAVDCNAAAAARRAGYSAKTAKQTGARLLTNVDLARAIADAETARAVRLDVTKDRVLQELARISFSDPRGFWDARGNLKAIGTLTAAQAACLAGFEAIIKNAAAGDGATDLVHKVKFWDKPKALELLATHLGLLEDTSARDPTQVFIFPPGTAMDWGTQPAAIAAKVGP